MSLHRQHAISQPVGSGYASPASSVVGALLSRLFGRPSCGELVVETPTGARLVFAGRRPGPHARLSIHNWQALRRIMVSGEIGFAEGYMAGEWSSPNLVGLLTFAYRNHSAIEPLKAFLAPRLWLKLRHIMNRNTRRGSRRNIAAHYDLGNEFYRHWLDAGMSYSAALFSPASRSLEEAQDAKLDRVLGLLDLKGGERVLEIGCGWGSFAERMLRRNDCHLTGVTLSTEQLAYAQRRLDGAIVDGRCDLRLQDYRDVSGTFERIVSIEMLEAVGEGYWPVYFRKLRDSLCAGGTAVLQVITIDERRFESYRRRPDFIQKHIFPGGMLPTARIVEHEAEKAGLQVVAAEFFAEGYARTLEQWNLRFQAAWPAIAALGFDERFKRTWEYYLAYCETGFACGALNVGLFKLSR
jgi:cyclopropane-fatty-acyl-phospholipid synthase